MSMQEHKQNHLSKTNSWGAGNKHHFLIPLLFLCILTLAASAFATEPTCPEPTTCTTHTSTAELSPEWSPAGQNVNYTVTFCKTSGATVNEVRIYQDYDGSAEYTNFQCNDKAGWEKLYISTYPACFYISDGSNPINVNDECQDFTFSATTPPAGEQYCNLSWKFETRDTSSGWKNICDTTSVDDVNPRILKTLGDPKKTVNDEIWITHDTPLNVEVFDRGDCGISGLDYCEYRYDVDGVEEQPWTGIVWGSTDEIAGIMHYYYSFSYDEDSEHFVEIRCYDIAGNEAYHSQTEKVDDTPPETTKSFDGPYKIGVGEELGVEWIDGVTEVVLDAVDPDPTQHACNIGVDETYYVNILAEAFVEQHSLGCNPEFPCRDPGYCQSLLQYADLIPQNWWEVYEGQFPKAEESCHVLFYYSVDELGNEEDMQVNCFFVDKTPPEMEKTVGEPRIPIPEDIEELGNGHAEWSEEQFYSGNYSAKLVIPDDSAGTDFAGVDSFFDVFIELDDITSLSYYRKVTQFGNGWSPIVILGIDADGDGVFEAQPLEWEAGTIPRDPTLLGDDSLIQCEATTGLSGIDTDFVQVDATTFSCYTATSDGTDWDWSVYKPLSYFQSNSVGKVEPTDKVAMVKIKAGGNPSTQDNEIVYVDHVELNGKVIIDEPVWWWVRDNVTEITMTCVDQEPHPSGDAEVCYQVSYDLDPWDLTANYCPESLELVEDTGYEGEWCCIPAPKTIIFIEDSLHDLEYFCRDAVNKKSEIDLEWFRVDSQPPKITKTMIDGTSYLAKVGTCPPSSPNDECYVMDGGTNGVHIAVADQGINGCIVNDVTCTYELFWEDNPTGDGSVLINSGTFGEEGADVYFTEDSMHTLVVNCVDALGNPMTEDVEVFYVDSTPPVTTKEYGTPTKVEGGYRWITSATPITLEAEDEKVGVDYIKYRVTQQTLTDQECTETCTGIGDGVFTEVDALGEKVFSTEFTIPQDSCHYIEFYSIDLLGNEEIEKSQCVFVDNMPPASEKTVGDPKKEGDSTFDWWVTKDTPITLDCVDPAPHPVGDNTACFKVSLTDDEPAVDLTGNYCTGIGGTIVEGWCCTGNAPYNFNFQEESNHKLEYICKDGLGNEEETVHVQNYKVDPDAPTTTKEYLGPFYDEGGIHYIDTASTIELTAVDNGPICHVDGEKTYYKYSVVADNMCTTSCVGGSQCDAPPAEEVFDLTGGVEGTVTKTDNGDSYTWTVNITSDNPAHHVWGTGMAFATSTDQPAFQVWHREYEEPFGWYYQEYTGTGWHGWGGAVIALPTEGITATGDQTGQAFTITVPKTKLGEDGCDTFYWGAQARTNLLGRYPSTWVEWSGGAGEVSGMQASVLGGNAGWNEYTDVFGIPEESCHLIEFYSEDALGNTEEIKYQCVFVDKKAPVTTKTYGDPYYSEGGKEWITSETPIYISATDPDPHPSGVAATYYEITRLEDEGDWHYCSQDCGAWAGDERFGLPTAPEPYNPSSPLTIEEESCHIIEYYSVDNVGKTEEVKWQCVFVDNTAPTPEKTVGEPKTEWHPTLEEITTEKYEYLADSCWNGIDCWKVTLQTPIKLDCVDPAPHPVDHEKVCYYVEVDGDDKTQEYCGSTPVEDDGYCCLDSTTDQFFFKEETEHNLSYYCVDALDNKGSIDDEKFKVEGRKFEIQLNKKWNLISVPYSLINPNIDEVLKDVKGDIKAVWTYDPLNELCPEEWCVYHPNDPLTSNLETMDQGWGYWVSAYDSNMLVIGGSKFKPGPVGQASRNLVEGWNLVGYYGADDGEDPPQYTFLYNGPDGDGKMAHCALYSLGSTALHKGWTALLTYWEPDNADQWKELDKTDNMDPGAGYWVSIPESYMYTATTSCGFLMDAIGP